MNSTVQLKLVSLLCAFFIFSSRIEDAKCHAIESKNGTLRLESKLYQHGVTSNEVLGQIRSFPSSCPEARSLTIKWELERKMNDVLDGYVIYLKDRSDGSEKKINVDGQVSSYTFNNLRPYTEFSIQIRPFAFECSQSVGAVKRFLTQTEIEANTRAEAPTVCINLVAMVLSPNIVQFRWTEPENKNGPLSGYVVEWQCTNRPDCPVSTAVLRRYENNFVINGLLPYTKYAFKVKAFNEDKDPKCMPGKNALLYSDAASIEVQTPVASSPEIESFVADLSTGSSEWASVVLSWKLKTDEYSPPTKLFRVEYKLKSRKTIEGSVDCRSDDEKCADSKYVFDGLQPNTQYEFSLRAKFENGSFGAAKRIETTTCPPVTSAPIEFNVTARTEKAITLNWQEPEKTNGSVSGYILKWTDPDHLETREERFTRKLNYTVNYLREFQYYSFSLSTMNVFGERLCHGQSAELRTRTSAGKPSEPMNFVGHAISSSKVRLTWTTPRLPRGNIEGYMVSWESSDGISSGQSRIRSGKADTEISEFEPSTEISGLEPYTEYFFSVYAYNEDDDELLEGEATVLKQTIRTYSGAPGPVKDARVSSYTTTSFTIKWSKPSKPNGPLSGYCVSISKKNVEEDCTLKNTATSYTFNGLSPRTSYVIKLLAYNEDDSPDSKGIPLRGAVVEL